MRETFRAGRRMPWTALIAALGVLAAASCATAPPADDAPLRIHGNITTLEIAPVLLVLEEGLYDGPATLKMGGVPNLHNPVASSPYAVDGLADIATNAETQGLRHSVDHPDMRMIMTVTEGLYRLVARRSAGVETLADLEGKRIATIPGTSSGYFLHRLLATVGLDENDVTIVPVLPLSDMPTALANGDVDAVTIWEPEMENAALAIGADAVSFSGEGIYRELFNLNTTQAALDDPVMRAKIVAFVRSLIEASRAIEADPSVVWPLVAESGDYDEDEVARAWAHHAFPKDLVPDLLDVLEEEELYLAALAERSPRSREELAVLIDTSVMEEALAGMETH